MNSHLVHRSLARIESSVSRPVNFNFFFFTDTSTTEIYTLSLHDALPISGARAAGAAPAREGRVDLRRRCQCYRRDRKSTRLNSSHTVISYAVFCLKKKIITHIL